MNVIATDPSDLSPVTMLEVNQHLHRGDEVDESISAKILAATRSIELTVGPIMDSSWRATFDRVPKHHYIYLPAWLVTEISAVVAIDGDGAFLMNLCGLPTIAWQNPPNLIHLLFDNQCYERRPAG